MTTHPHPCPLGGGCQAPRCKSDSFRWSAKSQAPRDANAFEADCIAYMQLTGERSPKAAIRVVFGQAMDCSGACVFA